MVMAKGSQQTEFEKVKIDEYIEGEITDIQERLNKNKKYQDKATQEWKVKEVDECRFVFNLDGYKFKHYSRWMTLSSNENANLFKKYITGLLGTLAIPDNNYNLDMLKGIRVKTMWDELPLKDGRMFQFVNKIKPAGPVPDITVHEEEEIPLPEAPPEEEE